MITWCKASYHGLVVKADGLRPSGREFESRHWILYRCWLFSPNTTLLQSLNGVIKLMDLGGKNPPYWGTVDWMKFSLYYYFTSPKTYNMKQELILKVKSYQVCMSRPDLESILKGERKASIAGHSSNESLVVDIDRAGGW